MRFFQIITVNVNISRFALVVAQLTHPLKTQPTLKLNFFLDTAQIKEVTSNDDPPPRC